MCSLKHFEVFDLLVVSKCVMNCPAQPPRRGDHAGTWFSHGKALTDLPLLQDTIDAQISLVWLTFGLCLDYWLVFTPPTSHYISYIHVFNEVCHKTKFLAVSRVRLRLFQFASSAWLLHSAAYVELFVSICIYLSHIILAFGNWAGR